jgi:hypothetical protein
MTFKCGVPLQDQRMQDEETLEAMVDGISLRGVLMLLEGIAYGKAQHIEENWQDTTLAEDWMMAGTKLGQLAKTINHH